METASKDDGAFVRVSVYRVAKELLIVLCTGFVRLCGVFIRGLFLRCGSASKVQFSDSVGGFYRAVMRIL